MKFAYIEVTGIETNQEEIPGREIADLICQTLNGDGPYARDDYGWEWIFRGTNYKALAVLQQYENGWLIPVDVSFIDRLIKRGAPVLDDMSHGIEKALGSKISKLLKFHSEKELRDSNV